jgi:hypothetical protein
MKTILNIIGILSNVGYAIRLILIARFMYIVRLIAVVRLVRTVTSPTQIRGIYNKNFVDE